MKHGGKCHCVPRQIHLWVLLFGPCPFLVALLFLWRNANLAGGFAGRLGFLVFVWFVVVSICNFCTGQLSPCTIFSHRLCLYQDRALVRHRPVPREKKIFWKPRSGSSEAASCGISSYGIKTFILAVRCVLRRGTILSFPPVRIRHGFEGL